jgi:hypothetical protein
MHPKTLLPFQPLLATGLLALTLGAAQANVVSNSSFEAPYRGSDTYCYLGGTCTTDGWGGNAVIISANSGAWGWPNQPVGYAYGNQLIGLQNGLYVDQSLSLAAGQYTLDWADSGRLSHYGSLGYGAAQYQVLFNNVVLGTFDTQPGEAWARNTLSFVAGGAGQLRFQGINLGGDNTAFIDDVVLNARPAQVPEPASLGLVGLALAGVLASARRRARR